jgi:hypothetical protein
MVAFNLRPGLYRAIISGRVFCDSLGTLNVSGGVSEFLLTENGIVEQRGILQEPIRTANLNISVPSPLIIREIYFGGSQGITGGNYIQDAYIEIYNNSSRTVYLDSLFVATVAPANSTASDPWRGLRETEHLPLFSFIFMVPGDGTTHPLLPGEGAVFARNALDHSRVATSGLRLDRAHFALYHPTFTQQNPPEPGVVTMELMGTAQGSAVAWSVGSPAFVIYRVPDWAEYRRNHTTWRRHAPGTSSGILYWHIDKDWILDGVEIITRPTAPTVNKRLPLSVDISYTWLRRGQYLGFAVRRKVEAIMPDGRIIYQDTNNSDEDFETDVIPKPALRPF